MLYEQFIEGEISAEAFLESKSSFDEKLTKTKSTFAAMKVMDVGKKMSDDRQRQRQQIIDAFQDEGVISNNLAERFINHFYLSWWTD